MLLDLRGEAGDEGDEFRVVLRRDVGLEPHLQDAEHLLFQKERHMEKWVRRLVLARRRRGALELCELGLEGTRIGLRRRR